MKTMPRAAFTLVECMLVLAVGSLSVLVLVALLPCGLERTRAAVQQGSETRVIEHLRQLCSRGTHAGVFYFDADGAPQAQRSAETIFVACMTEASPVTLLGDIALSLPRVRITISDRAAEAVDPFVPNAHARVLHLLVGGGT